AAALARPARPVSDRDRPGLARAGARVAPPGPRRLGGRPGPAREPPASSVPAPPRSRAAPRPCPARDELDRRGAARARPAPPALAAVPGAGDLGPRARPPYPARDIRLVAGLSGPLRRRLARDRGTIPVRRGGGQGIALASVAAILGVVVDVLVLF